MTAPWTPRERALRKVIETLLASAHPHPTEHPTMTAAWAVGRAAIADPPPPDPRDAALRLQVSSLPMADTSATNVVKVSAAQPHRPDSAERRTAPATSQARYRRRGLGTTAEVRSEPPRTSNAHEGSRRPGTNSAKMRVVAVMTDDPKRRATRPAKPRPLKCRG